MKNFSVFKVFSRMTWLICCLSFVTSLVSYLLGNVVLACVPIALVVGWLIMRQPICGVALCLSTLAWDQLFNPVGDEGVTIISVGRLLTIITIVSVSCRWSCYRRNIKIVRPVFILMAVCIVWHAISIAWSMDITKAIIEMLKLMIQIVFCYIAVHLIKDRKTLFQILFLLAVITALGAVYALFGGGDIQEVATKRMRISGVGINSLATQFGYGVLSALVCTLHHHEQFIPRALAVSSIFPLILAILRTGTRSVFAGLPLSILFSIIITYRRKMGKLLKMLAISSLLLVGAFYPIINSDIVGQTVIGRLFSVTDKSAGMENARWQLWAMGGDYVLDHPFGTGVGNEGQAFLTHINGESHNTFVSTYVQTGPLGFILLFLAIALCASRVLKVKDTVLKLVALLFLSFLLMQCMKASLLGTRLFWYPLIIVLASINISWLEFRYRVFSEKRAQRRRFGA